MLQIGRNSSNLQILHLRYPSGNLLNEVLPQLPKLTSVALETDFKAKFALDIGAPLAKCQHLVGVDLIRLNGRAHEIVMKSISESCPSLERLSLEDIGPTRHLIHAEYMPSQSLRHLARFPNLRKALIYYPTLIEANELSSLAANCHKLRELWLWCLIFDTLKLDQMEDGVTFPLLQVFAVRHLFLGDSELMGPDPRATVVASALKRGMPFLAKIIAEDRDFLAQKSFLTDVNAELTGTEPGDIDDVTRL